MVLVKSEEVVENGLEYIINKYDNGTVEKVIKPMPVEPTEPEPTESEMIQSEILLNQTKIIAEQESQSEILAELMLSQAEREVN